MLQQSVEPLEYALEGPGHDTLVAGDLTVCVAAIGTAPTVWAAIDSYTPVTGILLFHVGPGTAVGQLTEGPHNVYVKIPNTPGPTIVKATSGVTVTAY